jgi:hypothetical protein
MALTTMQIIPSIRNGLQVNLNFLVEFLLAILKNITLQYATI